MSQLLEKLKTMSREQLEARLAEIIPSVDIFTAVWNKPLNSVSFSLSWDKEVFNDTVYNGRSFTFYYEDIPDEFREFIHNFCTNLCAEKLMIETLLTPIK